MRAKLESYLQAVKAQMPVVNPNPGKTDGSVPADGGKPKGGTGGGKGGGGKGGQGGGQGGNKDSIKEGTSNGN
jgi:hypothetical protein